MNGPLFFILLIVFIMLVIGILKKLKSLIFIGIMLAVALVCFLFILAQ